MKKRLGQVTIFIILAMVLIVAIISFLLLRKGVVPSFIGRGEENPDAFLDSCLESKVGESIKIISEQGGYIENTLHKTFKFSDENKYTNISYLCYNQNYYLPCINQEPVLLQHLKNEIEKYISKDVEDCFDELTSSLERSGYVVDAHYNGFEIELKPKKVFVEIEGKLTLTKAEEIFKYEDFSVVIPTKFYELAVVVQEIISQEAEFCHFEHLGYMLLYPEYNIDKFRTGDSTIIYTVEHKDTKEKFRFAVRGCVILPGL